MANPSIQWDTAFARKLVFAYPVDSPVAWGEPREGSEFVQGASGVEDAWIIGTDEYVAMQVRWIPTSAWDGADGWNALLAWARNKNVVRFRPDDAVPGTEYDCYLVAPLGGEVSLEADKTRTFRLVLRTDDGTPITGF